MAEMGATTADHLEQTDEQGIAALKKANVQPVVTAGFGLRARIELLSARARNDRGRTCGRAGDRFQSRIIAYTEHADGVVPRVHANENVAGGRDRRVNRQCSIQR